MTITDPRTVDRPAVVRFHRVPARVRAAFRVLERTAPAAGARWAEKIWFGLPPPRSTPVTGTPFTVGPVVGETWGAGPTVYLGHGWGGHRGQLAAFVAPLVARGHRVVAFDTPSHGDAGPGAFGPRASTIPEMASALTAVMDRYGPAHAVVAHSAGATAAAAALCDGRAAARLVLLAPLASPAHYAYRLVRSLGGGARIHRGLLARGTRRAGPLHHLDVPTFGRAVAMPPTLVVHDRDDASIPVSDGAAIAAAWPSAALRVTAGLGHRRLLSDPGVVAEAVEFVAR